jgi:hypothetical protein
MRIPSGKIDQRIYFVAVDSVDLKTREIGLTGFAVQRSRNGGAAIAYTIPTVTEISSANMPGVYALLIDEDTVIAASSSDSEEYCVHITATGMAPVTRTVELYLRPVTGGETLQVSAGAVAALATDSVNAAALSANAVAEINAGMATSAEIVAVQADVDNIQTRLPAGLVGGRIDASVGAMDPNTITASVIATDAIDNDAMASNAFDSSTFADGSVTAAKFAIDAISSAAFSAAAATKIANSMFDQVAGIETGLTLRQQLRLATSALFSMCSGMGTATGIFRDYGNTKNRITATIDASGNRTAVTTDFN